MIARTARRDEVDQVLRWAAAEGWNPGHADAPAFMAADPDGFFVADHDGQIIAAISVVNHTADHAFLGLYLCLPEFRGQGHGYALWSHALRHAGGRTVGLDGVPAQQANYAASGFVATGATIRYGVIAKDGPALTVMTDTDALIALDAQVNGCARPGFARAWFTNSADRVTLHAGPGTAVTIRNCAQGAKIGPLYAPDAQIAADMVHAAARHIGQSQVYVDISDANPQAAHLAELLQGQETFRTARMYRGTPPHPDTSRLFGIATMELG